MFLIKIYIYKLMLKLNLSIIINSLIKNIYLNMTNNIKLISNDNKEIDVNVELLKQCKFFNDKLEESEIQIEIRYDILKFVIEHLEINKKLGNISIPEPLPDNKSFLEVLDNKKEIFDFIESKDFEQTFELINAGALLEYSPLHDLACSKIAFFMKGKTPDEVNAHFTIECQLTNEEAKELGLDVDIEQEN